MDRNKIIVLQVFFGISSLAYLILALIQNSQVAAFSFVFLWLAFFFTSAWGFFK